jgi:hypothetical protein
VTAWLTLLERAGRALYDQIQPGLGVILAARPSDTSELTPPYLKRRLFVGWRTWYGPGYVETFGRDLLLGLPDRAEKLDDGGVYQALDATPLDLVTGKPSVYAGVAAYLAERDIQPAWLRLPRPKSGNASRPKSRSGARPSSVPPTQPETPGPDTVDEDTGPDEFQQDVRELLSTVIVLTTGLRVLMLPLAWSELGESERMIAFRHLLYAVQSQLTQHPDCRVRVEFQEIPAELRAWLEASYPAGGPVSYGLLTDTPPD